MTVVLFFLLAFLASALEIDAVKPFLADISQATTNRDGGERVHQFDCGSRVSLSVGGHRQLPTR